MGEDRGGEFIDTRQTDPGEVRRLRPGRETKERSLEEMSFELGLERGEKATDIGQLVCTQVKKSRNNPTSQQGWPYANGMGVQLP